MVRQGIGALFEETVAAMKFLKNKGVKICLFSNALPNFGDSERFVTGEDRVFLFYKSGILKPDVRIFEAVLSGGKPVCTRWLF